MALKADDVLTLLMWQDSLGSGPTTRFLPNVLKGFHEEYPGALR
jgi:hypothetical protein